MRPGAWVELQDVDGQVHCDDGSVPEGWPLVRFCELLVEAFALFGTESHAASFGRRYLEAAGFVNIQHRAVKLPYGPWANDKCVTGRPGSAPSDRGCLLTFSLPPALSRRQGR